MKCVVSTFLVLLFSYCNSLTYLCKTKETFKLAELQWLEVELGALRNNQINGNRHQSYQVTKLLVDRATGSTLFRLETSDDKDNCHLLFQNHCLSSEAPPSLRKCDWILQVVCSEASAAKLVETLRETEQHGIFDEVVEDWGLGYIRMEGGSNDGKSHNEKTISYTKTSLMQAVAQALPVPPALDPKKTKQELLVVDTFCGSDNSTCYLGIQQTISTFSNPTILTDWSKRPFQYSSAINPQVAEIIIDMLWEMLRDNKRQEEPLTLLDPTCGSGTFLALAMDRGMRVEAYDYNAQCVNGSQRNMKFLFGDKDSHYLDQLEVTLHDSTYPFPTSKDFHKIDCVVANLPWGINSVDYAHQNTNILKSVRNRIDCNTPCAFVTRGADVELATNGFKVLGQAHVPQRGFQLPKGSKKNMDAKELDRNGRNHCVVTIARAE